MGKRVSGLIGLYGHVVSFSLTILSFSSSQNQALIYVPSPEQCLFKSSIAEGKEHCFFVDITCRRLTNMNAIAYG